MPAATCDRSTSLRGALYAYRGETAMMELPRCTALLAATVITFLVCLVVWRNMNAKGGDGGRARRVLAVVFGVVAVIVLLIVQFVPGNQIWLWALSILPASFVLLHAIYLAVFKNRRFFEARQDPDYSGMDPSLVPIVKAAQAQERQYYSTASLLLRFALPAVLLIFASLTVGYSLVEPPSWGPYLVNEKFLEGAQIGVVGAYIYVVLYLASRAMQHDITPPAVMWATATIAVAPVLAGSLQVLFVDKTDQTWTKLAVPFAAGFSLKFVSDAVHAMIRRMFATAGDVGSRRIPLSQLRGITREVEDRLLEESITDVAMLAMVNPHRLRRNTRFDKRQITSWIDEAILMTYLPNAWQSLETDGIMGAIHLVWYERPFAPPSPPPPAAGSPPASPQQPGPVVGPPVTTGGEMLSTDMMERIKRLAERNKLDVHALSEIILRMAQDAQVLLIRALYQLDETESSEDDPVFRGFQPQNTEIAPSVIKKSGTLERLPSAGPPELTDAPLVSNREAQRQARYTLNHGLFIVHTWRRSARRGQVADIIIRLVQHRDGPLTKGTVKNVEYYLGPKFSDYPIVKTNPADAFALSISAWGPVLCLAHVTFTDGTQPLDLERYLDFDTRSAG